jgi:hypothetical protein
MELGKDVNLTLEQSEQVAEILRKLDLFGGVEGYVDCTGIVPVVTEIWTSIGKTQQYRLDKANEPGELEVDEGVGQWIQSDAGWKNRDFFVLNEAAASAVAKMKAAYEAETARLDKARAEAVLKPKESEAEKKARLAAFREGLKGRKQIVEISLMMFSGSVAEGLRPLKGSALVYADSLALHKSINLQTGEFDGVAKMAYTVTHLPSGGKIGGASTMNAAKSIVGAAIKVGFHKAKNVEEAEALVKDAALIADLMYAVENHYYV